MSDRNAAFVFVYGTLQKGQPNHYLLSDHANGKTKYLGEAVTQDRLPLVVNSAVINDPYLLPVPGKGKNIEGEVYEVDAEMIKTLDKLEDCPQYYERLPCNVILRKPVGRASEVAQMFPCFAYFLTNFKESLLQLPMLSSFDANNLPQNADNSYSELSLDKILAQVKKTTD